MPIRQFPVRTGRKTITNSATQLTAVDATGLRGVQIVAGSANADVLYVGESSAVTADASDTTDGYPLAAGETLVLPTLRADELYLIADGAGSNKVWWILV
jgi:hypothetical protein